jgi:tetratricopeptide (TPR) repeat protein
VASAEFQEGLTPEDYAIYDQSSVDKFARSDSRQVELLSKYALALEMKGDLNEAEKNYRQALALNSMSVDLNYHLGSLYLKMHDYRQARIYLQRTLSLNRSHKEASEALKWLDIQGKGTGN